MVEFLKGKKTYLVAAAVGLVTALQTAGVLDKATADTVISFLLGTGLATLGAKINRL